MPSVAAELKGLRCQIEQITAELSSRERIGARIIWDQEGLEMSPDDLDGFSGLIVHLTPELSDSAARPSGLSDDEFRSLKASIVRTLDSSTSPADA